MAEVRGQLLFQREWFKQAKGIIENEKSPGKLGKIPRVACALKDVKPEAYEPQFVSFGPYHWTMEKHINSSSAEMSTAEAYKVQYVATFWQNRNSSLDDIVATIRGMREEIADFYDWPMINTDDEYSQHCALKMAIDSSFLLSFLFNSSESVKMEMPYLEMPYLNRLQVCINSDIIKLENQIPLRVLRKVYDDMTLNEHQTECRDQIDLSVEINSLNIDVGSRNFSIMLQETYKQLSPFDETEDYDADRINDEERQPHLLGFIHALVSPLVKIRDMDKRDHTAMYQWPDHKMYQRPDHKMYQRPDHKAMKQLRKILSDGDFHLKLEGLGKPSIATKFLLLVAYFLERMDYGRNNVHRRDLIKSYTATELVKGGIKLMSSSSGEIRFHQYSGTLYLPRITLSQMQTEELLRNMMALEFNDDTRGDSVTRYVGLMRCLIDTPDDVLLLRESHVIGRRSAMLSDQDIADMWKCMCHPFFVGQQQLPDEKLYGAIDDVLLNKRYIRLAKKLLWKFCWDHLSNPGKGIALLVGTLILAMTCAQTFFAASTWYQSKPKH